MRCLRVNVAITTRTPPVLVLTAAILDDLLALRCCLRNDLNWPYTVIMSNIQPPPFFLAKTGEPPIQWELWINLFEAYVEVLEDQECSPERYLAFLKHRLGAIGLREFKSLPPIDNVGDVDVYQLAKKQLHERYGRKINVLLERYKFYSRTQHDDETID
ncbi:hypothetical protein NDU88_005659 [Pleurodeles waltl]|uniref:Uncharacterized protein n=1 Tax=Pleurodeles waltl TaxID=8319 RepID=A0AAV7QHS3_PLEWA|nr:hypothetical protein NDU88_005659 [Pleurodeles waltl]